MIAFRSTETNTRLIAGAGAVLALGAVGMATGIGGPWPGALALGGAIPLLLGHSLQVCVDVDGLELRLGVGILRTRVAVESIRSVGSTEIPHAPWLGIRRRGGETVYAVGAGSALQLELEGGGTLIVAIRRPGELRAALLSHAEGSES